jgi:hypothetical protein
LYAIRQRLRRVPRRRPTHTTKDIHQKSSRLSGL